MKVDPFLKPYYRRFFTVLCLLVLVMYGVGLTEVNIAIKALLFTLFSSMFIRQSLKLGRTLLKPTKEVMEHLPKLNKLVYGYRTIGIILGVYTVLFLFFSIYQGNA